jgi:hypothetical protein
MPGRHELHESAQEQPWTQVHPRLEKSSSAHSERYGMGLRRFIFASSPFEELPVLLSLPRAVTTTPE